jgi:hypothetical protein
LSCLLMMLTAALLPDTRLGGAAQMRGGRVMTAMSFSAAATVVRK